MPVASELHVVFGSDGSIAAVLTSSEQASAFVEALAPDVRERMRVERFAHAPLALDRAEPEYG